MQAYWKRFAASVTGFAYKYRDDFFVRTEVNIIALQMLYALLILAFSVGALLILYHDIVSGVVAVITTALTSNAAPLSPSLVTAQFEAARTRQIFGIIALIVGIAGIFGYLVARFALAPARNALAAQKQFIGNIAHELRTPISIIKTNTEVRLLENDLGAESRKIHESNLEELDRISGIINNLLSLNALIKPERIPFDNVDLGEVVRHTVDKLSALTHRQPVRIRVRTAKERIVWGNATALEQVTMNIVKNAIGHTRSGEILITVGEDARGEIELGVRDTGSGIARGDLFRIFEPFYRGDKARTRAGGAGSGLGLSIVNELVKLHRGRISIQSAVGKGTTVTIALPRGKRVRKAEPPETVFNEVLADFSGGKTRA